MTDQSDTMATLRKYRWLIILAAALSSSTIAFTAGCALSRYLTGSVKTQLSVGLILAVLFPAVMLFLAFIRRDKSAARDVTLSDVATAVLMPIGMAALSFPRVCPEVADVLKQHVHPALIDAMQVFGVIALLIFGFLFFAALLRQLEDAES